MNATTIAFIIAVFAMLCAPNIAQEPAKSAKQPAAQDSAREGNAWTKALLDRSKRGTLHDAFQFVRGDTGRWSDEPLLLHAPPIGQKPAKRSLDDWFDQLLEKKSFQTTSSHDNWLLLRTRQLDDNDRLWVERIQREGNQFTVVLSEAIWQGRYAKTFTFYSVFGVNLGKLEPGKYEAKWIIQPLEFKQFEGTGQAAVQGKENWSKDDRPAEKKPVELRVEFRVDAE